MAWECDRCGQMHTRNPTECRSCGHRVLAPVSDAELRSRSEGRDSPEPLELDSRSPGTPPDEDLYSGPDTAPDGSLIREGGATGGHDATDSGAGRLGRVWWRLGSRVEVYSARPTAVLLDVVRISLLVGFVVLLWFVAQPYL